MLAVPALGCHWCFSSHPDKPMSIQPISAVYPKEFTTAVVEFPPPINAKERTKPTVRRHI